MSLRYPKELNPIYTDYVVFNHAKYRSNRASRGQNAAPPPELSSSPIVLYMPTTTPAVTQQNGWGSKSFEGPLQQMLLGAASAAGNAAQNIDISAAMGDGSYDYGKTFGTNTGNDIKKLFKEGTSGGGLEGAGKQILTGMAAGMAGLSASQLMAVSRGEIYNPNVELIYEGPKVRGFQFDYLFVPKSEAEAIQVNNIVKQFKYWAAPLDTGSGMYEIPHVWQVTYMSGGVKNKNMNAFKRSALRNVTTVANQGLTTHMSFPNGMPVTTSMSLSFLEVDVVTREDHDKAGTFVGY